MDVLRSTKLVSALLAAGVLAACGGNSSSSSDTSSVSASSSGTSTGSSSSVASMSPSNGSTAAYVDTSLQITFDGTPTLGTSGFIYVYNADTNTLVDKVGLNAFANGSWAADTDMTTTTPVITAATLSSMNTQTAVASADTEVDKIAGNVTTLVSSSVPLYRFVFYTPVTISGNTATIKLHNGKLAANTNYYVLMDNGVLNGQYGGQTFSGISSKTAWTFKTKADPTSQTAVTVAATGTTADFRTVQGALNWIMNNCGGSSTNACNSASVAKSISIADGTYPELLFLRGVNNLTISGASQAGTVVQYENFEHYNPGAGGSATVAALTGTNLPKQQQEGGTGLYRPYLGGGRPVLLVESSDLLKLTNFTLKNTHVKSSSYNNQAETIYFNSSTLAGSRLMATSMNFISAQDTIQTKGWAWFYNSYIAGDVDFLWGSPYAALFENTELHTVYDPTTSSGGYVIQSRAAWGYPGFVILNSKLTADSGVPTGGAYLARANGTTTAGGYCSTSTAFAGTGSLSGNSYFYCDSVAYINTTIGTHIADAGWSGTPNQTPALMAGWRESGSSPTPSARASTASTSLDLSSLNTRAKVFAQWNSNTGWTPTP